jgi:hypothetical protein
MNVKTENKKTVHVAVYKANDASAATVEKPEGCEVEVVLTFDNSDWSPRYGLKKWTGDPRAVYYCGDLSEVGLKKFVGDDAPWVNMIIVPWWVRDINFASGRILTVEVTETFEAVVRE